MSPLKYLIPIKFGQKLAGLLFLTSIHLTQSKTKTESETEEEVYRVKVPPTILEREGYLLWKKKKMPEKHPRK